MALRLFRAKFLLFGAALVVLLYFTRTVWLSAGGYALIHNDGPAKADIAVVLAGDAYGHRVLEAGELVRQGYVPVALVSGPQGNYGHSESDLAIPFAVKHGFPAEYFAAFPNDSHSTREEAADILPELRRRNVKSFLLVTSTYHSARARRIYLAAERAAGGGPGFRTVATADEFFRPNTWWHSRESQKIVFMEWSKTIATAFGM